MPFNRKRLLKPLGALTVRLWSHNMIRNTAACQKAQREFRMSQRRELPHPITINRPMVLIPAEEYKTLMEEAGYTLTPKLDREIARARENFQKGKTIPWHTLKHELL
jgi:PHD/YefM family antitoxin component YafN of YafNO toxin-antitoxin module